MTETKKTAKKAAPKTEAAESNLLIYKTSFGFEVELDKDAFDDFETFELISEIADKDDSLKIPQLFRKFFGERSEAVLDKIKAQHNGRAPLSVCVQLVFEVINAQDPNA